MGVLHFSVTQNFIPCQYIHMAYVENCYIIIDILIMSTYFLLDISHFRVDYFAAIIFPADTRWKIRISHSGSIAFSKLDFTNIIILNFFMIR